MAVEAERAPYPMRASLVDAIEVAWDRIARAGTWWTGAERLAMALEVRAAQFCSICEIRKGALSPYAPSQAHAASGPLSAAVVEAIHRLATDAARIKESWVREIAEQLGGEERYVEIIAVVATVTALDTLDRALGQPVRKLPAPIAGKPGRIRPAETDRDLAWVATQTPGHVAPGELDPFALHGGKNIHRAISLAPQEMVNFFDLDVELYLKDGEIRDFATEYRAITHAQIELIAARTSAINACFY